MMPGLTLENLANTKESTSTGVHIRWIMATLAAAWVVLLTTVSGVKEQT